MAVSSALWAPLAVEAIRLLADEYSEYRGARDLAEQSIDMEVPPEQLRDELDRAAGALARLKRARERQKERLGE